jgi:hypothetical protein
MQEELLGLLYDLLTLGLLWMLIAHHESVMNRIACHHQLHCLDSVIASHNLQCLQMLQAHNHFVATYAYLIECFHNLLMQHSEKNNNVYKYF